MTCASAAIFDERTGFWLRPGTLDRTIVGEARRSYLDWLLPTMGDVILDVGACFGAFARPARAHGAEVIAVEPHPENFKLLQKNSPSETNLNAAVIGNANPIGRALQTEVILYASNGKNTGSHCVFPTNGRAQVTVAALHLGGLIAAHDVNKLKLDCEGAEHELLAAPLPKQITRLALEWHLNRFNWREHAVELHELLLEIGFEVLRTPRFGAKNWTTLGAYRR